jgi:ZIP family zinc transporter
MISSMSSAFLWGLIATSSLVLGGLLASWLTLGKRTLGAIMAFGSGVLFSAVAFELVFEAIHLAKFTGFPTMGFFVGAFTFFFSDMLIGRMGGSQRMDMDATLQSNLVVPLVLAIILDGIPESVVIGLGLLEGGTVSLAMLVAVFISNLPEAVAATTGMRSGGWSRGKILLLWLVIAVVCALASVAGYVLLGDLSPLWLSFVHAFAGGAILMMLANTMIPEAYEHGGKLAGVFTVLGFAVSVWVIVLEHAGTG